MVATVELSKRIRISQISHAGIKRQSSAMRPVGRTVICLETVSPGMMLPNEHCTLRPVPTLTQPCETPDGISRASFGIAVLAKTFGATPYHCSSHSVYKSALNRRRQGSIVRHVTPRRSTAGVYWLESCYR